MDEKQMKQAQAAYETLCKLVDGKGWYNEKNPEKLRIDISGRGDDLPMDFYVTVHAERMIVILYSPMPFQISEDKRIEGAVACCGLNDSLVDGSFDYDISTGKVGFRMTTTFRESLLGAEAFNYLIGYSIGAVDAYNDKLLALSKGMVSLEQFMSEI